MIRKLLIANRGEIACRIIRTARNMGITTTAIYSAADKQSLHVRQADEAFYVGPAPAANSYLNIDAILSIAKKCHVDAIHPGYGFLSENADFARACEAAGIIFIGPSIQALQIMGSKRLSKQHLAQTDVPLIPGYHGEDQSDERLLDEATKMGFPILIKAANGGGGKGMREVFSAQDFSEALAGARREALACFADDNMLLEKLIQHPRHIEVQIMADHFGQVVHLFERDCSIQRRHQKVIEEAPASHLSATLRQRLAQAAITVAKTIEYRGAGTVECLVDDQEQFYFMEMNTRLQVEHPVTEMITGLDLVAWQIKIASDEPLPLQQEDIHAHGHAVECRLYAEDPQHDFLPSIGELRLVRFPQAEHVRIDTAITEHSVISRYYDPMIAKIIAWGADRNAAIQNLTRALKQTHIGGVTTNIAFLLSILKQPNFLNNTFDTAFLSHPFEQTMAIDQELIINMAAAIAYTTLAVSKDPLLDATFAWQMHLPSSWLWHFQCQEQVSTIQITPLSKQRLQIQHLNDQAACAQPLTISCANDILSYNDGQQIRHILYDQQEQRITLYTEQGPIDVYHIQQITTQKQILHDTQLTAPMPSTVVAILKQVGDHVSIGDALMVLEAMKMEHTIRAPNTGIIQDIFFDVGTQVQEGAILAAMEPL